MSDEYELIDSIFIPTIVTEAYLKGNFVEAIEFMSRAAETDPFNPDLHFFRGQLYLKIDDYYHAKWDFFTVKVLDPLYPKLQYYIKLTDSLMSPGDIQKPCTKR
jgi:hypothetical protein